VILALYGDMLRVPGSQSDLFRAKAKGADVRIVYPPIEAVKIARAHPDHKVVFLAIGFETTAPANAMAAWQARREGFTNFSMLVSHVLVPRRFVRCWHRRKTVCRALSPRDMSAQ
jgi:hydrogenase expression/formation protein HypD